MMCKDRWNFGQGDYDTAECQLELDHEGPHLSSGESEIVRGAPNRLRFAMLWYRT